ncbi:unnamed protein product, partial [Mesorhabditis spiculigera]
MGLTSAWSHLPSLSGMAQDQEEIAPLIIEHPLDVIVSKGAPATLNCAAKPSTANITWYKDGVPVITNKDQQNSHRIILDTGALFLLRVNSGKNGKDGDAGTYHCVARTALGEAQSREAHLRIAMLRDEFRTRPKNVQSLSGERAVLECSPPKGFPDPVVSWKKDDRDLKIHEDSRMTLHPDGNLIIDPVNHGDSGTYQCIANNMVGERVSAPARLSVYEKPQFIQQPKDISVEVGASVLFDCRVSGEPQPQISWKKRNDQMPSNRAYIAKDNRGLRIDRVQITDEGEYVCFARNPAGSIESSARLRVQAPPTMTTRPADVNIKEGTTAEFECAASGQPAPKLFWNREGQQNILFPGQTSVDGRLKVTVDGKLVVTEARTIDEGSYVCAAVNTAGSSLAKASLTVIHEKVSTHPPPIIELGHVNQTIMVGASAILPCQASGRTPPSITWLKDGMTLEIATTDRFSQHSSGSLQIADLTKTDSGVYTCVAKNADGESTWSASLLIEEHSNPKIIFSRMPDPIAFPSAPTKPTVANVSDTEADLEWSPPDRSGASVITGYIIQYFSPEMGETWFNVPDVITTTKHRVQNLRPSSSFVFIVRAENEKGLGAPSEASSAIQTLDKNSGVPLSLESLDLETARQRLTSDPLIRLEEVKTINATAVRLFWKRRKMDDLIQGYYIKWKGPTATLNQWVNVSGANTESYVVGGLLPFTNYEFFVIPYHRQVQGTPSNSMDAITAEAPPSLPPTDVKIRMHNMTTLKIGWRPPPPDGMNGILKGFQIIILGKGTKFNRNITTNERAGSVTLFHLQPGMTYKIRVAARTNAGIGVAHGTDVVTMNEETLARHLEASSEHESFLYKIVSTKFWIILLVIMVWLVATAAGMAWWLCKRKDSTCAPERMGPFIKINDGSVHSNAIWQDMNGYNTAQRIAMVQRNPPLYSMTPNHHDFYGQHVHCDEYHGGTLARPPSEQHYHYAQLTGGPGNPMSTFYGGQYQDDPSPYATTTLVMCQEQPAWLNDRMLRGGPALPMGPIPSGPPARYTEQGTAGRRSRGSRASERHLGSHQSDSPPHTDVSYVQSSDGTGGSSGKGRRSPPKNLVDILPPPPGNPPPPPNAMDALRRRLDDYDRVSDHLLHQGSPQPRPVPQPDHLDYDISARPTSRNRTSGGRHRNSGSRDDDSQRSSLMEDADDADCEISDTERRNVSDRPEGRGGSTGPRRMPSMGTGAFKAQNEYESRTNSRSLHRNQRPSPGH